MVSCSMVSPEELSSIEENVESGLTVLDAIAAEFQSDPSDESRYWIEKVKGAKVHLDRTETVIGFVGATGVGKSKCINALLGEDLLPVSESQACTACPVEILYNSSESGGKFCGVIEFIKSEDWVEEVKILIAEIANETSAIDWNMILQGKMDEAAQLAFDKIKAVYPKILLEQPPQLSMEDFTSSKITQHLDTKVCFGSDDVEEFTSQLQLYIGCQSSEENTDSFDYWPLVRKVRVYAKAPILECGIVIVDLPGVQDNNSARAAVAVQYLERCSSVLILAPVVRARNDKVALDFLHTYTGKQLRMNGTIHHAAFVCTKTDEGLDDSHGQRKTLNEVIKPIDQDLSQLNEEYKKVNAEHSKLRSQLGLQQKCTSILMSAPKRKRVDNTASDYKRARELETSYSDAVDDLIKIGIGLDDPFVVEQGQTSSILDNIHEQYVMVDEKRDKLSSQLATRERDKKTAETKHLCNRISARNQNVQSAIQSDFSKGLDKNMIDGEKNYSGLSKQVPYVFCICSDAYLKLLRGTNADVEKAQLKGFLTKKDTGLPALEEHCRAFATDLRLKSIARFATALKEILFSIALWAVESKIDRDISDEERKHAEKNFNDNLGRLNEKLNASVKKTVDSYQNLFNIHIGNILLTAQQKAVDESEKVCSGWSSIHHRTYSAVVRRGGCFTNARGQTNDFNGDLGNVMYEALDEKWHNCFDRKIQKITLDALTRCQEFITNFNEQASLQLKAIGGSPNSIKILQKQSAVCRKMLAGNFGDAEHALKTKKKSRKQLFVIVSDMMKPGYKQASAETGKGKSKRMQRIIALHLEKIRQTMFSQAASNISNDLASDLTNTSKRLGEDVNKTVQSLVQNYRHFLTEENKEFQKRQLDHIRVIHPVVQSFMVKTLKSLVSVLKRLGYDNIPSIMVANDDNESLKDYDSEDESLKDHDSEDERQMKI